MNNWNKVILYVGPSVAANPGLQDCILGMNSEWQGVFAGNAEEAWRILEQGRFDAVVSEDSLPDTDGLEFLNRVHSRDAKVRRLAVVDLADRAATIKWTGASHHCVPAPWDTTALSGALQRTFDLRILLSNEKVRQLVGKMSRVPSPPDLYFNISKAIRSQSVELEEIANLILRDLAITAKLLQLANSAALGLRSRVTTVQQAIQYLGLEMVRSLVLLAHTFSYFDKSKGFSLEKLWNHSMRVAALAQQIADHEGAEIGDEAFLAGLLHDLGKLLLAVNLPEDYTAMLKAAQTKKTQTWQEEIEKFGATHAEIGAELLATWNFPLTVVEAVALHHHPAQLVTQGFSPLTAVYAANALIHEISDKVEAPIEMAYLTDLGLEEHVDSWRELATSRLASSGRID
ncbi:MAG TPA: response regulator [Verrucomicrobiae bacterium]